MAGDDDNEEGFGPRIMAKPAEPKPASFNKDEVQILKQSRLFQDLIVQEGWKVFIAILDVHIYEREKILQRPMQALPEDWKGMDYQTKQAALESIKGALIGLRLARDLPSLTIQHGQAIISEHTRGEEE